MRALRPCLGISDRSHRAERSQSRLGLLDAYPFVLCAPVIEKLQFADEMLSGVGLSYEARV
jgi:hypothetical protein